MKRSRFTSLFNGLNGAARTVYGAVPMQEPWTVSQICAELVRQGKPKDREMVSGCLKQLEIVGLVERSGEWRRDPIFIAVAIKSEPKPATTKEESMPDIKTALAESGAAGAVPHTHIRASDRPKLGVPAKGAAPKLTVAERMNILTERIENLGNELLALHQIAGEIGRQAETDMDEMREMYEAELVSARNANAEELAQLRQLKALMKSIGG